MGESRSPPFVICHLCGRKYGTKSIAIHTPQCQKKWHSENKKLPKHLRRRLPSQPDYGKLQSGDYSSDMIDQMNEMSFKAAQAQLIPCENCGRTFYPEKLPVHQKSCTADKPARAPVRGNTSSVSKTAHNASYKNDKRQNEVKQHKSKSKNDQVAMILCAICMKKIPGEKIQTHLVCCNQEKIKYIQQTELSKDYVEVSSEKIARPKTRTIRRAVSPETNYDVADSLTANDKDGTYDIIKPSASYTIEKSVVIDNDFFPCNLCNRKFTKDRINQHKAICSKLKSKGRRMFDSSKQRLQGVEIYNQNKNEYKRQSNTPPKSNWRQKHKEFIQSIRAAKHVSVHMAKGGKASDIPPPPPSLNPDYVHCKYCDRRFNPEVAERHIPKCATIMNRPAPPKKKALDVYNKEVKNKGLKKSETFSVRRSSADKLQGLLSNASYPLVVDKKLNQHPQKKTTRNDCSGYVSPRIEKRYDSFEKPVTKNNNSRPQTSLGDYKAPNSNTNNNSNSNSNSNSDNSSKDKYVTRKISLQKHNSGYSYNSDKRKSPPRNKNRDFIF